jgi:hypothetical protein
MMLAGRDCFRPDHLWAPLRPIPSVSPDILEMFREQHRAKRLGRELRAQLPADCAQGESRQLLVFKPSLDLSIVCRIDVKTG